MDSEECGDKRARPEGTRRAPQKNEKQDRIGGVQQDIDEDVPAGVETEELDVDHMRDPGERMPVRRVHRGGGPGDVRDRQSAVDVIVLDHVVGIIEADEWVMEALRVDDHYDEGEA